MLDYHEQPYVKRIVEYNHLINMHKTELECVIRNIRLNIHMNNDDTWYLIYFESHVLCRWMFLIKGIVCVLISCVFVINSMKLYRVSAKCTLYRSLTAFLNFTFSFSTIKFMRPYLNTVSAVVIVFM